MVAALFRVRARPLRMRLLLLAACGLLPLLMVLGWGINHLVEERRAQAERSVLDLSRALATALDAELRSIASLLEQLGTSDELEQANLRAFYQTAKRAAAQLGWRQVIVSDGEGRILMRTVDPYGVAAPQPVDPESIARVLKTRAPVVSRIVETPQQSSDSFAVRVPVLRSGAVVYVLTAVLSTDRVSAVLTRQNIPTGSVASVFDQVSHRVARSRQVSSPFPTPSLQALLDGGGLQGAGRTFTREGVENYTGFTRLPDSGWVVVTGTSVTQAQEGLYALLRALGIGIAASLALSLLLAWVLSRRVLVPIEALKKASAALGHGDPVKLPATNIVELEDLAVALTHAAQDRDRSREQVANALRTAEDANRSKDQFLAMLGHELRNPLAPIATAVQLMALKGEERTVNERRIIERQLAHVTRLVDDLLDVSRITGGRLAISRKPVLLADVLSQAVETLRQSQFERALSLELGAGMDDAWVAGDEVRLAQVFNNLLVNAAKFTRAGDSIRVVATAAGGEARIDVEDTGVGIPPDDLERVFELFYQAPQSSDRSRGGLGLGLPIVRSLVGMHGGSVRAISDGSGRGTTLVVTLPLCEAPASAAQVTAPSAARGAGKILVVDDNQDAADTCAALLELSGYTVRVAYTPQHALDTLETFVPDVAILDIGLPGMSGYELAVRMKAPPIGYPGKLVALTGYGRATDVAASQQAGFDAHMTKPVAPEALLSLVEKLSAARLIPTA